MFKNYLTIAFRNLRKSRAYSAITILGLAVGLACCLVILLFVRHELSYDRFHAEADRIFRVVQERTVPGGVRSSAKTSYNLGPRLASDLPEVEAAVRIFPLGCFVEAGGKEFTETPYLADPAFLEIFSFPLIRGDKSAALRTSAGIIVSESFAAKSFGTDDPIGKTIVLNGRYTFTVTGVMKDVPASSHFRFDLLGSTARLPDLFEEERAYNRAYTYFLVREGAPTAGLEEKVQALSVRVLGDKRAAGIRHFLQPLRSIHLHSRVSLDISPASRMDTSYFLSAAALAVLLIAGINFVNLSTARAVRRAKEVGIRKAAGASRRNLVAQFLGESVLAALFSLAAACILAQAILPLFNKLSGRGLEFSLFSDPFLVLAVIAFAALAGLAAGIYPAFVLSSFSPAAAFKGHGPARRDGGRSTLLRRMLVAAQFAVTIAFVAAAATAARQISYVESKDLGFSAKNVIEMWPAFSRPMGDRFEPFRNALLTHPDILEVTGSAINSPGDFAGTEVEARVNGRADQTVNLYESVVDLGFFDFFRIKLKEGRMFRREDTWGAQASLIVNEAAARLLGYGSAVGKRLDGLMSGRTGTVIGVVSDYHNVVLYEEIKPCVYSCEPQMSYGAFVRLGGRASAETIAFARRTMSRFSSDWPVYHAFTENRLAAKYDGDRRVFEILRLAFALSIVIACLGLLGLVALSVERRTKEIGIRKVLGASISGLMKLITTEYIRLFAAASLVAWPVAYYFMSRWLRNFAYRISLGPWPFVMATGAAVAAAILVVALPVLRAARSNPVDSLRNE